MNDDDKASRRHRRRAGGFTLLEVLIALVVVAYAFVGLLGLHNRSLRLVARGQDQTFATLAAREIMSRLDFEPFPDLGVSSGDLAYPSGFHWELEVTEVAELEDIRRVVVRVLNGDATAKAELVYYVRNRDEDLL
jgi:general secretion pathway protein I